MDRLDDHRHSQKKDRSRADPSVRGAVQLLPPVTNSQELARPKKETTPSNYGPRSAFPPHTADPFYRTTLSNSRLEDALVSDSRERSQAAADSDRRLMIPQPMHAISATHPVLPAPVPVPDHTVSSLPPP